MTRQAESAAQASSQHPSFKLKALSLAIAVCLGSIAPSVLANPTGGAVVSGTGTATFDTQGNTLTVTNSNGAIINWQTFNIGKGEKVHFQQDNARSTVLNRVGWDANLNQFVGKDRSLIEGILSSNGQVFLVNPNGITFSPTAVIDMPGLIASTLNISDADFMARRFNFFGSGSGSVVNQGKISTSLGGSVVLIGAEVRNEGEGIITTPQGHVILAAGNSVSLSDTAGPELSVTISASGNKAVNLGEINAAGGKIDIFGALIEQQGILRADSASVDAQGRIILKASESTTVSGTLSAANSAGQGGTIEVLGKDVTLTSTAKINASGATGGGTVLVGGDYQGRNPDIQNAQTTTMEAGAVIAADAIQRGNGGKVILWSDDATRAYGTISARGGATGGDGGFVEVSGHRWLDFNARVNTLAPFGKAGTLLLDPSDITIGNAANNYGAGGFISGAFQNANVPGGSYLNWSTIVAALGGGNVEIRTSGGTGGNGDINIVDGNAYNSPYTLTLLANRNINVSPWIGIGNNDTSGTGGINLVAGWNNTGWAVTNGVGDIFIDRANIAANAPVMLRAGNNITLIGDTVGSPTFSSFGRVIGKTVSINAGNNVSLSAAGANDGGYIGFEAMGASLDITAGGIVSLQSAASSNNNEVHIQSAGTLNINASQLQVMAGTSGHGNRAIVSSDGDQSITLSYAGSIALLVQAGGSANGLDYGNEARIEHKGPGGNQTINLTGNGGIELRGGAGNGFMPAGYWSGECSVGGVCSGNHAGIENFSGSQTLAFSSAGSFLNLIGGSGGNHNGANIENKGTGSQTISGNPAIMLIGGTSGGGTVDFGGKIQTLDNGVGIESKFAPQNINAASLTLNGGTASYGGAFLSAPTQNITVTGAVTLNGGTGSAPAAYDIYGDATFINPAIIGYDVANTINLTAGSLTLNGGLTSIYGGSPAAIGGYRVPTNVTIHSAGNISFSSSNAGSDIIGSLGGMGGSVALYSGGVLNLGSGTVQTGTATGRVSYFTDSLNLGNSNTVAGEWIRVDSFSLARPIVFSTTDPSPGSDLWLNTNKLGQFHTSSLWVGSLARTGNISIDGPLSGTASSFRNLVLETQGSITQTAAISLPTFDSTNCPDCGNLKMQGGNITLGSLNYVDSLAANVTGNLLFRNGRGFNVNGITTTGGNVSLDLAGGAGDVLGINKQINAGTTGIVSLTSSGSVHGRGTSPAIVGGSLNIASNYGIGGDNGLLTQVPQITSLSALSGGDIDVENFGDLVVGPATPSAAIAVSSAGKVLIAAHSPLTVNGGVSAVGDVTLNAEEGGPLVIGGNVTSTGGNVFLTAGSYSITGTITPDPIFPQGPIDFCSINPALCPVVTSSPTSDTLSNSTSGTTSGTNSGGQTTGAQSNFPSLAVDPKLTGSTGSLDGSSDSSGPVTTTTVTQTTTSTQEAKLAVSTETDKSAAGVLAEAKSAKESAVKAEVEAKKVEAEAKQAEAEAKSARTLEGKAEAKQRAETKKAEAEVKKAEAEAKKAEAEAKQAEAEAKQAEAEAKQAEAESAGKAGAAPVAAKQAQAEAKQAEAQAKQAEAQARKSEAESKQAVIEAKVARDPDQKAVAQTTAEAKQIEAEAHKTSAQAKKAEAEAKHAEVQAKTASTPQARAAAQKRAESKRNEAEVKKTEAQGKHAQAESKKAEAEGKQAQAEAKAAEAEAKGSRSTGGRAVLEKQVDAKKAEAEAKKAEAEVKKAEAEVKKAEAQARKAEIEGKKGEAQAKKVEAQAKKAEVESKKAEADKKRAEADKKTEDYRVAADKRKEERRLEASKAFAAVATAGASRAALENLFALRHELKTEALKPALNILTKNPSAADLPACGAGNTVCIPAGGRQAAMALPTPPVPTVSFLPQIQRKVAVVIGVNKYADSSIPSLESAVPDAEAVGQHLHQQLGYDVKVVSDASRADIVTSLNKLSQEVGPNDSVTVYYAGHGYLNEKSKTGYWIPSDGKASSPENWISNNDIGKLLSNIPAKQVMLVSDSCYSGSLTKEQKIIAGAGSLDPTGILSKRSVTVMSSGGEEPVSDEGKDGHSIFAYNFMSALKDVKKYDTGAKLFEKVRSEVVRDFPQTPQYGGAISAGHAPGGDYLLEARSYK